MAFLDTSKANVGFKKLLGKSHTDNAREIFNESIPTSSVISAENVFGETINSTPATAVTDGVAVSVTLDLEAVSGTTKSFRAKVQAGSALITGGHINPLTGVTYATGDFMRHVIPESFGSDFRPILKNNGGEIPPLSSEDWVLDSFSGIVVSEDAFAAGTKTLECYVYVGEMVTDRLGSVAGGAAGAREKGFFILAAPLSAFAELDITAGITKGSIDLTSGGVGSGFDFFRDVQIIVNGLKQENDETLYPGTGGVDGDVALVTDRQAIVFSYPLEAGEKVEIFNLNKVVV